MIYVVFLLLMLLLGTAFLAFRRPRSWKVRARLEGEEHERRYWVRELHDETLQELAAVTLLLGTAAASPDEAIRAQGIKDAKEAVGRQIQALRRLISQMRPLELDTYGLSAALEELGRHAHEATGVQVDVCAADIPRLAPDAETSVYRVVQEALNNALRHSGAARVTITVATRPTGLEILVRDDGCGSPTGGFVRGHGLRGMRERAETLGADLDVGPAGQGHGTQVRLRVPRPAIPRQRSGS